MINKKTKKNIKKILELIISIIVAIILLIYGKENKSQVSQVQENENGIKTIVIGTGDATSENNLHVYYIDVGQADSILIKNKDESALIDAGNNEDGKNVVEFIKSKGITKLNYVIGTHPHEDHIGGLDDVINNIEIDKIYLPNVQTTTKTYDDVLTAIKNKNKTISSFSKGDKFNIGNAKAEVMTDSIINENNLNLSSNIIRMQYENTSFLFTGDAEKENENMRSNWPQTDILKVGHHGSSTSTSQKFLNQIKPNYAIISVGKNNDYGHPNATILKRLNNIGAKVFRTDESGTIEIIVTENL